MIGSIKDNEFQTSQDNCIYESEFLREHNGEIVKKIWVKGRPNKTTQQIRFIYLVIRKLAEYLGYADQADLKRNIKESIGYFEIKETKNLLTKFVKRERVYKSFADLKKDAPEIETILRLCDELQFEMRQYYAEYMGKQ